MLAREKGSTGGNIGAEHEDKQHYFQYGVEDQQEVGLWTLIVCFKTPHWEALLVCWR